MVKEVALNLELSNGVYLRLVNQAGHMGGMRFIATADADVLNNYGDKIRVFGISLYDASIASTADAKCAP